MFLPDLPPEQLHACIQVSADHAGSLVDIGPDPNSPQAAEFRSFWGDKSELRRFQVCAVHFPKR